MERRVILAVILFTILCVGLQVQPKTVEVTGGIGTEYTHIFTVINDEPQPLTLTLELDEYSTYLADSATIEPQTVSLLPQESKNLQLRGVVPVLGPETHRLKFNFLTSTGETKGSLLATMPIDGTVKTHPQIDLDVADVRGTDVVAVDATLSNFGNVITYYSLSLAVNEQAQLIGEIAYPRLVQVLPGEQELITLLFTEPLDPGDYTVTISGIVNQEVPVSATQPFRVLIDDGEEHIEAGSDLILAIKRYSNIPEITYIVAQQKRELLRDTVYTEDNNITIPFSQLEPGEYDLTVRIVHGRGTDTSQFTVVVKETNEPVRIIGGIIIGLILIGFLFSRRGRLELRILRLHWHLFVKERQLKTLLRKAERIARYI